ncbi:hypothetical protein ACFTSD_19110 [Nocardiaceae bacterium NPDC056970]
MTPQEKKDRVPAQEDAQSDPGGRDTWAEEGGATTRGPATDTDTDSDAGHH